MSVIDWLQSSNSKIAMLGGGGNIGSALAQAWVQHGGLPKSLLRLTHRGSTAAAERLESMGLSECACTSNAEALKDAGIAIICLRAQDFGGIADLDFSSIKYVVCLTAGVSLKALRAIIGREDVFFAAVSGHDLIHNCKGVIAIAPSPEPIITNLFSLSKSAVLPYLPDDTALGSFFALLPLPAGLVTCKHLNVDITVESITSAVPGFQAGPAMFDWALRESVPIEYSETCGKSFDEHIGSMMTKGGLTEAMVHEIIETKSLEKGVAKSLTVFLGLVKGLEDKFCTE